MPTPTIRADGGIDARVAPGEAKRLTIPTAADGAFFVGLRNLATNAPASVQATTSLVGDPDPVLQPLVPSLAAGAVELVLVQARLAAIVVTVPAEADGDVIVNILA